MAARSARRLWTDKLKGISTGKRVIHGSSQKVKFRGTVLGIDPSLRGTGLSVIEYESQDFIKLLFSKTLKFKADVSADQCLGGIAKEVSAVLNNFSIDHVAVEATIYVNNFRIAQTMGASRGAAVGIVAMYGKPVHEYSPLSIKKAVVGQGRASKEQVSAMVGQILKLEKKLSSDESDASAVALCHAFTWRE